MNLRGGKKDGFLGEYVKMIGQEERNLQDENILEQNRINRKIEALMQVLIKLMTNLNENGKNGQEKLMRKVDENR